MFRDGLPHLGQAVDAIGAFGRESSRCRSTTIVTSRIHAAREWVRILLPFVIFKRVPGLKNKNAAVTSLRLLRPTDPVSNRTRPDRHQRRFLEIQRVSLLTRLPRMLREHEVEGSNPSFPTTCFPKPAQGDAFSG